MLTTKAHQIFPSIKALLLLKGHCKFAMAGGKAGNMSKGKIT